MRKEIHIFFIILSILLILNTSLSGQQIKTEGVTVPPPSKHLAPDVNFGKIPLYFVSNKGQVNEKAVFYAKTSGYTLWVTKEGLVFDSLHKQPGETVKGADTVERGKALFDRDVSRLVFHNANKNPVTTAVDMTEHRVNYFIGNNQKNWKRNIPTSKAILYKEIYKNIDLKVYGIEKQIEYDWIVKPGGNAGDISFEYQNVKATEIDAEGDLVITTQLGKLTHKRPVSYQWIDDKKTTVEVDFKKTGKHKYGFKVGTYNESVELVIDPIVLVYSTYFGGVGGFNQVYDIAVDNDGFFYIAGLTSAQDFPVDYTFGYHPNSNYVYVTKFSIDGQSLVFSTLFGGSGEQNIYEIALDSNNCIYATGFTDSTNFPITAYAYQDSIGGELDAFVTKISSSGNAIVYSTYLGGSLLDRGYGIDIDSTNSAYITGRTNSTDFPTQNAYDSDLNGTRDAFITKLSADGRTVIYSSYLGGDSEDLALGISVDQEGYAYITGWTESTNFPTYNAFQSSHGGGQWDSFITKFNQNGLGLAYSTYLGGSNDDTVYNISIDNNGCSYVTGSTYSSDFPTANNFCGWRGGDVDCFITRLSETGTSLVYSTFIGGGMPDHARDIAVDDNGIVYFAGYTNSADFLIMDPYQNSLNGTVDCVIGKISFDGINSVLEYSTYFGGSAHENPEAIAVNNSGTVYITGTTYSVDFPLQNHIKETYTGIFISKFQFPYTPPPSITISTPNGGENWHQGQSETITWDYFDITGTTPIRLILLQNDAIIGTIEENLTLSDGSYSWTVGEYNSGTVSPGAGYKIRIETMDGIYSDQSDASFTIGEPLIPILTLTYPSGLEHWITGETYKIRWESENMTGNIVIEVWKNDTLLEQIGTPSVGDGTFEWLVPGTYTTGSDYQIRISQGSVESMSPGYFTISDQPAFVSHPDFNNDDKTDILWRDTITGQNGTWMMNGTTFLQHSWLAYETDTDEILAGSADFNGDGNSDLVWRNRVTGVNTVWYMNGTTRTGTATLPFLSVTSQEWEIAALVDVNGDNHPDILWSSRPTRQNGVWFMNGITRTSIVFLPNSASPDWRIAGAADFNSDSHPDILWRNTTTGQNAIWYMNGTTRTGVVFTNSLGIEWVFAGLGDMNRDGKPDIIIRHKTNGENMFWLMNNATRLEQLSFKYCGGAEWEIRN